MPEHRAKRREKMWFLLLHRHGTFRKILQDPKWIFLKVLIFNCVKSCGKRSAIREQQQRQWQKLMKVALGGEVESWRLFLFGSCHILSWNVNQTDENETMWKNLTTEKKSKKNQFDSSLLLRTDFYSIEIDFVVWCLIWNSEAETFGKLKIEWKVFPNMFRRCKISILTDRINFWVLKFNTMVRRRKKVFSENFHKFPSENISFYTRKTPKIIFKANRLFFIVIYVRSASLACWFSLLLLSTDEIGIDKVVSWSDFDFETFGFFRGGGRQTWMRKVLCERECHQAWKIRFNDLISFIVYSSELSWVYPRLSSLHFSVFSAGLSRIFRFFSIHSIDHFFLLFFNKIFFFYDCLLNLLQGG